MIKRTLITVFAEITNAVAALRLTEEVTPIAVSDIAIITLFISLDVAITTIRLCRRTACSTSIGVIIVTVIAELTWIEDLVTTEARLARRFLARGITHHARAQTISTI
jgi:hypothetical protein